MKTDLTIALKLLEQDAERSDYSVVGVMDFEDYMVVVKQLPVGPSRVKFSAWTFGVARNALHWQDELDVSDSLFDVLETITSVFADKCDTHIVAQDEAQHIPTEVLVEVATLAVTDGIGRPVGRIARYGHIPKRKKD